MTSLVGILCKDGVVIGADSAVSFSDSLRPTIEQPYDKIEIFDGNIIVVGTGEVGLGQRFCNIVTDLYQNNLLLKGTEFDVGKTLSRTTIEDFASTHTKEGQYGALVAFPLNGKAHLVEFGIKSFQPEWKNEKIWFSSMGCVQTITDSFLAFLKSVFWGETQPNLSDGIFAVKWTLDHAVEVNPGGVNRPVCLAVLQKQNSKFVAKRIEQEELEEHEQNIQDARKALVEFRNQHHVDISLDIPSVQKPDPSRVKENSLVETPTPMPSLDKEILSKGINGSDSQKPQQTRSPKKKRRR